MRTTQNEILCQRLNQMGILTPPTMFPQGGVPLLKLIPWWRLWPRDARYMRIGSSCASVFPVAAGGILHLKANASLGQAIFAAMLPIHDPATLLERCKDWVIGSIREKSHPGPASMLGVLEHLLSKEPESVKLSVWREILESAFDTDGNINGAPIDQVLSLLDAVGRTGLRELGPMVTPAMRFPDDEVLFSALACLVRLGYPNDDLRAETLMNLAPECSSDNTRWAIAFAEVGDLDLLAALLKHPGWGERVQILKLVESVLISGGPRETPSDTWRENLIDLLLAQLQQEEDRDVAAFMALPLGLALRHAGDAVLDRAFAAAALHKNDARTTGLMNAFLVAGIPATRLGQVDELRSLIKTATTLRAMNRLLQVLGEPSSNMRDWIDGQLLVIYQTGYVELPKHVQPWFDAPGDCPTPITAALLADKPDSGLAASFCAAHFVGNPGFLPVLERLWIDAADNRKPEAMKTIAGILAGAAAACAISPFELRCCLGYTIAGPLDETPEMVGQLLGLLMTQEGDIRESAHELLLHTSPATRAEVGCCLQALKRCDDVFAENAHRRFQFGIKANQPPVWSLARSMDPVFNPQPALGCQAERLLEALELPGEKPNSWVVNSLPWAKPESVQSTFSRVDSATLASAVLRASSSSTAACRNVGAALAAGVGTRLLETNYREMIIRRVTFLSAHDPNKEVRETARKAAEILGILGQIPETTPPSSPEQAKLEDPEEVVPDADIEAWLNGR